MVDPLGHRLASGATPNLDPGQGRVSMQVRQAGEQHAVVNCQHFVRSWQVGPRRPGLDEFDHAVANSYDSRSIKTGCRADKPRCRDQQVDIVVRNVRVQKKDSNKTLHAGQLDCVR